MPQTGFILSVAGLGVSLAGFSGLVIAFRRGGPLKPIDAYRLRLLPEMALATSFIALVSIPLADAIGDSQRALQVACGLALLFTFGHILRLVVRVRAQQLSQPAGYMSLVIMVDVLVLLVAAAGLALGTATLYEWTLVLLLARPGLAFVFVLGEVTAG